MGFDSKGDFPLPTVLLGISYDLGHQVSFFGGSNILLLMVVQQQVAILEFSQKNMSACLSIPPSCSTPP